VPSAGAVWVQPNPDVPSVNVTLESVPLEFTNVTHPLSFVCAVFGELSTPVAVIGQCLMSGSRGSPSLTPSLFKSLNLQTVIRDALARILKLSVLLSESQKPKASFPRCPPVPQLVRL